MKITSKWIFVILPAFLFSCNKPDGYVITGNVTGFPDSTKVYLQNVSTEEIIDSAIIGGNTFKLKGQLSDVPEQLLLTARVNDQLIYLFLLIGNEHVNIHGDIKDFPWDAEVEGSNFHSDYNCLENKTKLFDRERDSLAKSFFKLSPELQQEKHKEIWDKIKVIDDTVHAIRVEYVKTHINTYPGIIYLGYLKRSFPKDTVRALYNKLSPEIKSSKYARIVEVFLNEKISGVGDKYHDFKAVDKTGDTLKFSDLTGKYILLDFTGAYCGPCVQSAKELRHIDKTYSDSLVIVSFSSDSKKEIWLKSLERDSVSWISLWDGEGTFSETYIKYGVNGIPAFFLIDPKGIIIDKWGGYGIGSLEEKLSRFKPI